MEPTTPLTLLPKPSKRQEIWKPQFTDEQRAKFERIAAIDRRANDMAYARELVQMFYWRDVRDRKQWFAETMQRITKKQGYAYAQTIRSYMTEIRMNEYEIFNQATSGGSPEDEGGVGKDEASP